MAAGACTSNIAVGGIHRQHEDPQQRRLHDVHGSRAGHGFVWTTAWQWVAIVMEKSEPNDHIAVIVLVV